MACNRFSVVLIAALALASTLIGLGSAGADQPAVVAPVTWGTPSPVYPATVGGTPQALSCASRTFCLAADATGHYYLYRGTSWSGPRMIPGRLQLTSLTCTSSTDCRAVEHGRLTRFDGHTWTSPRRLEPGHDIATISCTGDYCAALDTTGGWYFLTGHWSRRQLPRNATLSPHAVSCASNHYCLAIGFAIKGSSSRHGVAQSHAGSHFSGLIHGAAHDITSVSRTSSVDNASVSCVPPNRCAAFEYYRNYYHEQQTQYAVSYVGSAKGRDVALRQEDALIDAGVFGQISCTSRTFCADTGSTGITRTGGPDLDRVRFDSLSPKDVEFVSCVDRHFCMALDDRGFAYRWNGSSWQRRTAIVPAQYTTGLSCPSVALCVSVDLDGVATRRDGSSVTVTRVDPLADLTAVSCPTEAFCAAVDDAGRGFVYRDGTWSAPSAISSVALTAVSCSSPQSCVAVGGGDAVEWTGSGWGPESSIAPGDTLRGVSCPTASTCYADGYVSGVDANGTHFTHGIVVQRTAAGQWNAPQTVSDSLGLLGIDCPTDDVCGATAPTTNSVLYLTDGTWTPSPSESDTDDIGAASGPIACRPDSTCVVPLTPTEFSAPSGQVAVTTPSGIAVSDSHIALGEFEPFSAVQCPTDHDCVVVGRDEIVRGTR